MDVEVRGSVVHAIPQDATTLGIGLGSAELHIWGGKNGRHLPCQAQGEAIHSCGSTKGRAQKGTPCQFLWLRVHETLSPPVYAGVSIRVIRQEAGQIVERGGHLYCGAALASGDLRV